MDIYLRKPNLSAIENDLANFLSHHLDQMADDMVWRVKAADMSPKQFYTIMLMVHVDFLVDMFIQATTGIQDPEKATRAFTDVINEMICIRRRKGP